MEKFTINLFTRNTNNYFYNNDLSRLFVKVDNKKNNLSVIAKKRIVLLQNLRARV